MIEKTEHKILFEFKVKNRKVIYYLIDLNAPENQLFSEKPKVTYGGLVPANEEIKEVDSEDMKKIKEKIEKDLNSFDKIKKLEITKESKYIDNIIYPTIEINLR